MKAKPKDEFLSATGDPFSFKYPITAHTTNPERKEMPELISEIMILFDTIGESFLFPEP